MTEPVSNLSDMLAEMRPLLDERRFAFRVLGEHENLPEAAFAAVNEAEGRTAIVPDASMLTEQAFARITLQVHSALGAIGLTAAVSAALAEAGIACNVIAGFHHDHLFVPWVRREEALAILMKLSDDVRR